MVEIWKDIVGYEGLYKVSNLGNVMSFWGKKPHLLRAGKSSNGYLQVDLTNHNKSIKNFLIHRLVAQAFIPNPQNLPFVNHKDENKKNNREDNLEFCTQQYNNIYGTRIERASKSKSKPVLQYDKNGIFINEYPSIKDAERHTGIYKENICSVCKGKLKTAGGYVWRYKQP